MRRGVFVSSLLIAGSALCAPAFAQSQDRPAEASAALAEAAAVQAKAAAVRAEPPAVKAAAARPARPAPVLATPNGQVMDRAREIAEADLAAAPDEESRPLRVDPNMARKRAFALPRPTPQPAAEDKPVLAEREAQPAVAEARAEAKPALAERDAESQPVRSAESQPRRGGGDPVVKPVYAQRRYEPAEEAEGGDPVVRPTYRQRRWEPAVERQAEHAPAAEPRSVARDADGRPDYAEAERIVREVNARANGEPLPAAEAGRMANAAPAVEAPAEAAAPAVRTAQAADAAPVTRAAQAADAAPVGEAAQVADAAEVAGEAADSGSEVLRDAARAARVVRQAGRVAKVLGGAAIGAVADAPVYAREEREEAPVYAEEERDADRGYAREERGEEPVYAEEEPRAAPVYQQRREAPVYEPRREAPVYEQRRAAPVYAEDDRDYPPVYATERPLGPRFAGFGYGQRRASREAGTYCDDYRYDGLLRAVRRAVEVGSIDWRTARDMEREIAYGEDMQRSYCASGLNGWRAQRLDAQYSQIEDRLRFERGRFR